MSWENKVAIAGVIPLALIPLLFLAMVSTFLGLQYGMPSPGTVAASLVSPLLSPTEGWLGDWRLFATEILVNLIFWIVFFMIAYALIRKRKVFLRWTALPLAAILALECDGLAERYSFFKPGAGTGQFVSPTIERLLAVLIGTACWLGILTLASRRIPRLRAIIK
jgi:hypothetical protein